MAINKEIQKYVKGKYVFLPKTCLIAHKKKYPAFMLGAIITILLCGCIHVSGSSNSEAGTASAASSAFSFPLILDGAMGTQLIEKGMPLGVCPEKWILENPDIAYDIQKAYVEAGSQVIYTPTFGANSVCLENYGLVKPHTTKVACFQLAFRPHGLTDHRYSLIPILYTAV